MQIKTLNDFRNTFVFRFATRAKNYLRVVRHDDQVFAIDPRIGRVYMGNMDRPARRVRDLHHSRQGRLLAALRNLGVLSADVAAEWARENADANKGSDAAWLLSFAASLRKLGVPYTKAQLRKLSELAAKVVAK